MQQSPNNMVCAGARANSSRSGHLAMISGQSRRSRRVKALAVPASGNRDVCSDSIGQETKLRFFLIKLASFALLAMCLCPN